MIFAGQIGACQITAQIIFGSHIIRRKRIADLIQGSGNGNETADVVVDQKLAKLQLLFFFRRIGMYGADITLFPEKRCNVADRISPEIVVLGGNQKGDGVGAFGTEPRSDSIGSIFSYAGFLDPLVSSYHRTSSPTISRMRNAGIFFMVGVMIPVHCTIVPISSIASSIGAKNSYWFLVLVYTAFNLAQAVYLYIGFIQGIDRELDEAAIIDGCNDVFLLTKILAPICKPIIATETIFVFISGDGELIFSLILLSKPEKYTVSRVMLNFTGEHSTDMEPQFAFIVSV